MGAPTVMCVNQIKSNLSYQRTIPSRPNGVTMTDRLCTNCQQPVAADTEHAQCCNGYRNLAHALAGGPAARIARGGIPAKGQFTAGAFRGYQEFSNFPKWLQNVVAFFRGRGTIKLHE